MFLTFLTGCSTRDSVTNEIKFMSVEQLEVDSNFTTCQMIESVNGVAITPNMYSMNEIKVGDTKILCNVNKKTIDVGTETYTYEYKGVKIDHPITLVDSTPPTIEVKDSYEVELENEYFSLSNYVLVNDNFDSKESIFIGYTGTVDVNKVGDYRVKITAKDKSNNSTEKEVLVSVVDRPVDIIEVPPTNNDTSSNTNGNNSTTPNTKPPSNNIPPSSNGTWGGSNVQATDKRFMFTEYDRQSAFVACNDYVISVMDSGYIGRGGCNVLKKGQIEIGYEAKFN